MDKTPTDDRPVNDEAADLHARALAAHRAGERRKAKRLYRELLAAFPGHLGALQALASFAIREGEFDAAQGYLDTALAASSAAPGLRYVLGNLRQAEGELDAAREAWLAELELHPDTPGAHHQLCTLATRAGRYPEAFHHGREAVRLNPRSAIVIHNLARAYLAAGESMSAEQGLRKALQLDERFLPALLDLAELRLAAEDLSQARQLFEQVLQVSASSAAALRGLGMVSMKLGEHLEAVGQLRSALVADPQDQDARSALAGLYAKEFLLEEAESEYREILQATERPGCPLLCAAGEVALRLGKYADALALFERAREVAPGDQSALRGAAQVFVDSGDFKAATGLLSPVVMGGQANPELLVTYVEALAAERRFREGVVLLDKAIQARPPASGKRRLHFAMAWLLEREYSYELAFHHARQANHLRTGHFDSVATAERLEKIAAAFDRRSSPQIDPQLAAGAAAPVLIVGLPRSGCGLLARVLGGHPRIACTRGSSRLELVIKQAWHAAGALWPDAGPARDAQLAQTLARDVFGLENNSLRYVVHATWHNFAYLGLVAQLLPNLRVIECTRDLRDIALGCYMRDNKDSKGLPFAYDLRDISEYIQQYQKLMSHWRRELQVPMLQVSYEQLVTEPAKAGKTVASFLDLDWPNEHLRLNATPSDDGSWHLSRGSLRRYRHYAKILESIGGILPGQNGDTN